MITHNFECTLHGLFESQIPWDHSSTPCPRCGKDSELVWLPRGFRELTKPIVLFKDPRTGQYEFPGHSGKATPKGLERIEIRNSLEYKKVMRDFNNLEKEKFQRERDRYLQGREKILAEGRKDILHQLSQESDPSARAVLNEAIKSLDTDIPDRRYSEVYSEAMEFDSSNRERDRWGDK